MRKQTSKMKSRGGFSLVEIVVAMGFLCLVLMSLTKISFTLSKRSRDNSIVAKRTFALIKEANKFGAMPYTTLTAFSTANSTVTDGSGSNAFTYTRTLTITTTGNNTVVKIKITPSQDATRVDSVFVYRSKPASSPLCTTC